MLMLHGYCLSYSSFGVLYLQMNLLYKAIV